MMYVTGDDFRQVGVIAKNELRKFIRGRKILLYILLVGLIVALNIYFITTSDLLDAMIPDSEKSNIILNGYASTAAILALIGAVLFASYTIVSEYEERTYLLLFTRPIKKTTIFVGKFLACYFIVLATLLIYYGISSVHTFALVGTVSSKIGHSLFLIVVYTFAVSGIAMLLSTIVKRGSVSALMTFFMVTMIPGIIWTLLVLKDFHNFELLFDTNYQLENYGYLINVAESAISEIAVKDLNMVIPTLSMFLWGMIPLILAWVVFVKKEV